MSGDVGLEQTTIFYSKFMTETKRIALEKSEVAFVVKKDNLLHQVKWRTGSPMQE
tara:strand:- start:117 stop:281 length:165 start_codon:yes stop_codon:yes gene_type:complete